MKHCWLLITTLTLITVIVAVPSVRAGGPIEGRAGRAEVRFLEGMIDHHQMALDMAGDCLAKAQTESVITLCQTILDAQSAEIETMRGWLSEWYGIAYTPMAMNDHMTMMNMMSMMGGMTMQDTLDSMESMGMGMDMNMMQMMMQMMGGMGGMNHGRTTAQTMPMMMGMMAGFADLEGIDYEIAWLEAMIDHHDDALNMSERILTYEDLHPEVRELAQAIISTQTAEIELMEGMIAELSAAQ